MTIIYFILILGVLVFVHELGHFIFAKKFKTYVYEFAIGMGPKLFSFKRKNDETVYSIRLLPIGGFCNIAGEDYNEEEQRTIPAEQQLYSKTKLQRFIILVAGATFNFIFAFILLLLLSLFTGSYDERPFVNGTHEGYPAFNVLEKGDLILELNDKKVTNFDEVNLKLQILKDDKPIKFTVKRNNEIKEFYITLKKETTEKVTIYRLGVDFAYKKQTGFLNSITYTFTKFTSLISNMAETFKSLITGKISVGMLSGPVGIYNVVDQQTKNNFGDTIINLVNLSIILSINLGFVNLIPFPAVDGGRIFFLLIEAVSKKKINRNVEAYINFAGFALLMLLMLLVTINDFTRF